MIRRGIGVCCLFVLFCSVIAGGEVVPQNIPGSRVYVPTRVLTQGPAHHWFGYYDKLAFDPTGRYVLSNAVDFEGRSPRAEDRIRVGMIDLADGDRWVELGSSSAWGWQQGCMLQFIPGSATEVIWNDREGDRYVSRIKDIETGAERLLPFPIYTLSPDGRTALSADFERINHLRPGYGYAGIADPNASVIAPADAGIYRCDLQTGERELIISIAQMSARPIPEGADPSLADMKTEMNWFNHLLFNTDGTRFVFLHRWRSATKRNVGGFGTLMFSADPSGREVRLVDGSGYTSHFIWRDADSLAMWTHQAGKAGFYLFQDDGSDRGEPIGAGVMTRNGHNTYLPGNEWILNDSYPNAERQQEVYLFHVQTQRRVPLGAFFMGEEYRGEWRCDTHPRSSPDGKSVVIDTPVGTLGRQLVLMDISAVTDIDDID